MIRGATVVIGLLCLIPVNATTAAVIINEVAWMGTIDSANDEWIELYNDGPTAVSVDDWTLSDGVALDITLLGEIPATSYAVLERTDDTSAPGTAFLIYAGALANTGVTLTLRRADGTIEDTVAGGENWVAIGGDNLTKDTAQLTNSGWVTGMPTPGAVNVSSARVVDNAPTTAPKKAAVSSSRIAASKQSVAKVQPINELALEINIPDVVYVNQSIELGAVATGLGDSLLNSLKYRWNFGDMQTANGKTVEHVYDYPGEYIVTVWSGYASHEEVARETVTVLPVTFSLTKNMRGDVQIHNDSPYEVNVSGFSLAGITALKFPERSFIPMHGTVTVAASRVPRVAADKQLQLLDREGNLMAVYTAHVPSQTMEIDVQDPEMVVQNSVARESVEPDLVDARFNFSSMVAKEAEAATMATDTVATATVQAPSLATSEAASQHWTWLGAIAVALLALVGVRIGNQTV